MAEDDNYQFLLKLLLIGNSGVGKSSLLSRFVDDQFSLSMIQTMGIDYKNKVVQINGHNVKLQIWDTAGQERFRNFTAAYYRGAMGIFLVFDITDEKSFKEVQQWIEIIETHATENVLKVLVGNKADRDSERLVSPQQGADLAKEYGMPFYETSAKSGEGVEDCFMGMAKSVMTKLTKNDSSLPSIQSPNTRAVSPKINIQNNNSKSERRGCCG
ncbi:small gtp binding protein rab8 [Anaeramoeba ignava]|uniref:Ras-related protein Rab-1 n=1 Tax=Anaeramoeba ignava TaxID=1746090 RepID=A0A9Q0LBT6_ANAIG|nr:small gtp binding protein rab8 [Anaeramoeba ignava]